ncbi:MAG: peptidoglycan-binding protein [Parcubacteria group bacterium]|nr:peptidoglycan-binding protein [Parcubacteria group bacterium]
MKIFRFSLIFLFLVFGFFIFAKISFAQSVTVNQPNGGECLKTNQAYSITWTRVGGDHVALYYRSDGQQPTHLDNSLIDHGMTGSSFNWTPSAGEASETGRIWAEIHDADHNSLNVWDQSNANFSVRSSCPTIGLSPASFSFSGSVGGSNPPSQTLTVTNTGASGSSLSWTGTSNQSWLSISPTSGGPLGSGASNSVSVSVNIAGLTEGTYNGTITISGISTNKSQTVSVALTINPAGPTISLTPSSFNFTATTGANPASQTLTITNVGPSGSNLNWSASDNAAWLTLSPTSGGPLGSGASSSPVTSIDTAGLAAGTYNGTITISDASATNSPQTAGATLTLNAASSGSSSITTGPAVISSSIKTIISLTGAEITWQTDTESYSQIEYGPTINYEFQGQLDAVLSLTHKMILENLLSETTYHFRIASGRFLQQSIKSADFIFTTLSLPKSESAPVILPEAEQPKEEPPSLPSIVIPPPIVNSIFNRPGNKKIELSWTNPDPEKFKEIKIIRKEDKFPSNPSDGETVFQGMANLFLDESVKNGVRYFYSIFTFDEAGNFSEAAFTSSRPRPDPPETPLSFTALSRQSKNAEKLNDYLREIGYLEKSSPIFDEKTKEALKTFQKDKFIRPTGRADLRTLHIINQKPIEELGGKKISVEEYKEITRHFFNKDFSQSKRSQEVKLLQKSLYIRGYYFGRFHNLFDALTKKALIKFQKDFDIPEESGKVGPKTQDFLNHYPTI